MRAELQRTEWEIQFHRQAFHQMLDEVDGEDCNDSDFDPHSDTHYEGLEVRLVRALIESERLHGD